MQKDIDEEETRHKKNPKSKKQKTRFGAQEAKKQNTETRNLEPQNSELKNLNHVFSRNLFIILH
jgi:hypothetical protein